ncbi:3-hydroxyacyl-ACP dehydratase FabZ family protein [Micromonospora tarensis]|uniref:ApeI dehydratase-like domain-containing protein n=1 Tax=Micromonospora tarensis TaxID=2806100 RepID=A0ABS1YKZ9_9ACTN|nr:hypothetical protein [Micromonospora tarensis]MBM0278022.1 hypothetical protein [Micromonospora tarensis]
MLTTEAPEAPETRLPSPVRSTVQVGEPLAAAGGRVRTGTVMEISPTEPVFAGHYPDFPIFPGVCLIECARLSAEVTAPDGPGTLYLEAVESSRFGGPVRPGDRLSLVLTWTALETGWRTAVRIRSERGDVASIRLRLGREGRQ